MSNEITGPERSAMERLRQAIAAGVAAEIREAESRVVATSRETGAAAVWEAWAFLSAETSAAVDSALRRERDVIRQRLEALYADPSATWEDIIAASSGSRDDEALELAS